MDRLCDEILQIILNELDDPTPFSVLSKRLHQFTQDPYVRASYFLSRYGRIQALYWAFGRGKLMNNNVIDILLSSGAHLSRYIVQSAIHHYFRTQVPFIKTKWVRSLSLPAFTHFMNKAALIYGDFPVNKGDDDGSIFNTLLKESRFPTEQRSTKWEVLRDVVEKYKFIPFCNKDPMMAQFPLVLAIEPRLLPLARANGFHMDFKYRNFVFRKMFEKPAITFEGRADEIIRNVRELSKLDSQMFLSKTVAAEICMEAKTNDAAYTALKRLDKDGQLKYELSSVVEELIKLFANTRSVRNTYINTTLCQLYRDFPSSDRTVRNVLLLSTFLSQVAPGLDVINPATEVAYNSYFRGCKDRIEALELQPITREDIFEVLISKFTPERFRAVLHFARMEGVVPYREEESFVTEVALRCLEIGCKGKLLKGLVEQYPRLSKTIAAHVLQKYRIGLEDLPPHEDEKACMMYEAPLCKDYASMKTYSFVSDLLPVGHEVVESMEANGEGNDSGETDSEHSAGRIATDSLGHIGQDSLTTMIRKDELAPSRGRRRYYEYSTDGLGKMPFPADCVHVGKWVRTHYGPRSPVTAVFMLHAVVNDHAQLVLPYLAYTDAHERSARVPVTLKHFKMLARLGKPPHLVMYDEIENGMEFFFSEEDYLTPEELSGTPAGSSKPHNRRGKSRVERAIKTESTASPIPSTSQLPGIPRGRKRPRRSAASVKSYVVPDSDDEDIVETDDFMVYNQVNTDAKKRKVESNLQQWIKHLSVLLKDEQKKYKEKKKRAHAAAPVGAKVRVQKSEFFKSLANTLTRLRKIDQSKRQSLYGADVPDEDYSEGEEDEYQYRTSRPKRRKTEDED